MSFFRWMEEIVQGVEPWLVELLMVIRGLVAAIREYLLDLALYGEQA